MDPNTALKEVRKQKGYTLEEMSRLLGYKSKVTYYNIENNKTKVSLENAVKITRILDYPLESLFVCLFKKN